MKTHLAHNLQSFPPINATHNSPAVGPLVWKQPPGKNIEAMESVHPLH